MNLENKSHQVNVNKVEELKEFLSETQGFSSTPRATRDSPDESLLKDDETKELPARCIHKWRKEQVHKAKDYTLKQIYECNLCVGFDVTCEDYGTK
ncbi:MAG TPA: hypothetical protein VMZ91_04310 [Candidatus Paceibacterota bacterium]|nr:hypothetical protein [Candidatus Paceibacterota bacterium]